MVGGPVGTAAIGVLAVAVFVIGYLNLAVCGTGLSLILFGVTLFLVGLAVFPAGGPILLGMSGFMGFLLAVVGIVFAYGVAGCPY